MTKSTGRYAVRSHRTFGVDGTLSTSVMGIYRQPSKFDRLAECEHMWLQKRLLTCIRPVDAVRESWGSANTCILTLSVPCTILHADFPWSRLIQPQRRER